MQARLHRSGDDSREILALASRAITFTLKPPRVGFHYNFNVI